MVRAVRRAGKPAMNRCLRHLRPRPNSEQLGNARIGSSGRFHLGKRTACSAGSRIVAGCWQAWMVGRSPPQDRSDEAGWLVAVGQPSAERSLEAACGNNTKMRKAVATTKATTVPIVIQSHAPFRSLVSRISIFFLHSAWSPNGANSRQFPSIDLA